VKPNMPVFDVLDFNWLTCWVNTLESVSSLSLPKKKKKTCQCSDYSKPFVE
jgi:hypothetical protein